jgi:replicative DNA helicase
LARDLDVVVLCLSQLSRSNEADTRAPRLSDLRDSGRIEEESDAVFAIHRRDRAEAVTQFLCLKQRQGPTFSCNLTFVGKYQTFTDSAACSMDDAKGEDIG